MSIKRIASIIEGCGLLLLLISFGWQCWEESEKSDMQEYELRVLHEKIDHLWDSEYHKSLHNKEYGRFIQDGKFYSSSMNYININNGWIRFDKMKEFENSTPKEIRISSILKRILYILGSLAVLYPKLNPQLKIYCKKSIVNNAHIIKNGINGGDIDTGRKKST